MIKENIDGFAILITSGREDHIKLVDRYNCDIWIHNNIISKIRKVSNKYKKGDKLTDEEISLIRCDGRFL